MERNREPSETRQRKKQRHRTRMCLLCASPQDWAGCRRAGEVRLIFDVWTNWLNTEFHGGTSLQLCIPSNSLNKTTAFALLSTQEWQTVAISSCGWKNMGLKNQWFKRKRLMLTLALMSGDLQKNAMILLWFSLKIYWTMMSKGTKEKCAMRKKSWMHGGDAGVTVLLLSGKS